jgi:hypothetical protein
VTGLTDLYPEFLPPTKAETRDAIANGLVVLDTNVLLDTYRFAPKAREELFQTLEALGDRLWIPHQVGLEFSRNRFSAAFDHRGQYENVRKAITALKQHVENELAGPLRELEKRAFIPNNDIKFIADMATSGLESALRRIDELDHMHGTIARPSDPDQIFERLAALLSGKVGEPLAADLLKEAREEAKRRISEHIPPGYLDKAKDDPTGDYLLWTQTLTEATRRKVPLILVTRDEKEDWFWRVNGRTISARHELTKECRELTGVRFILMRTQSFLEHAPGALKTTISPETIDQARALRQIRPRRVQVDRARARAILLHMREELDATDAQIAAKRDHLAHTRAALDSRDTTPHDLERLTRSAEHATAKLAELETQREVLRYAADQFTHAATKGAHASIELSPSLFNRVLAIVGQRLLADPSLAPGPLSSQIPEPGGPPTRDLTPDES